MTKKTESIRPSKKNTDTSESTAVVIKPPNMRTVELSIQGTAPLVIHRFGAKAKQMMIDAQTDQTKARSKKNRPAKDFEACFNDARYRSEEGWDGISASSFRAAAIRACRLCGYQMTMAKLSIFIVADGYDATEGVPLVRIEGDEPEMWIAPARNDNGSIDLRSRPMWREWGAKLRVRFDADQFTSTDIVNLFMRVGEQVGIAEGRPNTRKSDSPGLGFGLFEIVNKED